MPYMPLWDASTIYVALREEGGPSTSYHRQVVITNPDVLFEKYTAYRSIIEQSDLLDTVGESVEAVLMVRLQSQFETCVADHWLALANLREHTWRLVLHYLSEGNILEAKQYLGACFPRISRMIDDKPALAFQTYEYLLASLREKFDGEEFDLSIDTQQSTLFGVFSLL